MTAVHFARSSDDRFYVQSARFQRTKTQKKNKRRVYYNESRNSVIYVVLMNEKILVTINTRYSSKVHNEQI